MAIYHFSMQVIFRGKGQLAIASVAYRSGEWLYSERYDKVSSYHHWDVIPDIIFLKPKHVPLDWEKVWNEVEKIEKPKNAQLAREFTVALPIELSNQHLALSGIDVKISKKSNADLGLVQEPTIHEGDVAWKMEQEGRSSASGHQSSRKGSERED